MTHRIRYYGVFNDPGNYAPNRITERGDVIQFPTLEDARDLMRTLQRSDDPSWLAQSGVRTLDNKGLPLMPGVSQGASIMLYPVRQHLQTASNRVVAWEVTYGPDGDVTDPYPSHIVRVGAHGGIITEEA